MKTQQKYIDMPKEIAIELVGEFLQPGMSTLGMWFGWNQPSQGDSVKLGSVYGYPTNEKLYWDELFGCNQWLPKPEVTIEDKKDFIKMMRSYKKNPRDGFEINGLFECDEVFFPYSEMDIEDQMLYRLMVMSVNTCGTDYHEWSIELGYELAENYSKKKSATVEWKLYEDSDKGFTEEFMDRFGDKIYVPIYPDDGDHYAEGIVDKHVEEDDVLWLEELVAKEFPQQFYTRMFGICGNLNYTYWQKDVNKVLTWFVAWMQDEWKTGNLNLTSDTPNEKLNAWLRWVDSQPVLPIFEETV
jgi:hypothetical protein